MSLRRVVVLVVLAALAQPSGATAQENQAWKPFQEFEFLLGSWSGTADSGGRIGGRSARWSIEFSGNYLVHRGNTTFLAQGGQPEENTEEVGYYVYDREKRGYIAFYYYSTGVMGTYDVELLGDGGIRLDSQKLVNFDPGAKTRLTMSKKGDAVHYLLEVAPAGKEFVPYISSDLTKK